MAITKVGVQTLILVDDHPIVRLGLRSLITKLPSFEIIGEAEEGIQALNLVQTLFPTIAIIDVYIPGTNGLLIAEKILQIKKDLKVILLSSFIDKNVLEQGIALGVRGIIVKDNALTEIEQCLLEVSAGNFYISPLCYKLLPNTSVSLSQTPPAYERLTATEKTILKLVAQHRTTKEIANILHNSYKTIERHRYNICRKLNLEGQHSLLSYALEYKDWLK